ncbi:MAG: ABC transporter ATP-binding protein [Burkholderiaceae bacterium]
MSDLFEVTGLTAGYAEAQIISNIDFVIKEGETLALLGRNGVGKTTLINTLIGVTKRHAGQIKLGGVHIEQWTPYERVRKLNEGGIGWVPQERNIFKSLSVHENLTAVERIVQGPHVWDTDRVYQLFPRLLERQGNLGSQLSGGEQQMLAVARALMVNPRVLLLDEPLEGLAPIIVEELLTALKMITRREGISAIIVEQHPQLILSISDHALVLERGQVVLQERAEVLLSQPALLEKLLGVQ